MDEKSNVVGFGGRSLDGSNPKYINSPESDYFQKRFLLYNLSNAKINKLHSLNSNTNKELESKSLITIIKNENPIKK